MLDCEQTKNMGTSTAQMTALTISQVQTLAAAQMMVACTQDLQ